MTVPPFRRSDAFAHPVVHGFFGAEGGVSEGPFESANIGGNSGDRPEAVAENRARVARALGFAPKRLVLLRQVHGARCVTVDRPIEGEERADGLASRTPGLLLGALSADCAPVLFADRRAGVIGAAHAGWRGARAGILESVIEAMRSLGAREIDAAVGPCIGWANYEVGGDFEEAFAGDPLADPCFRRGGRKARFDLEGYALARLRRAGARRAIGLGEDTYGQPGRYFSARRAAHSGAGAFGVQLSAIGLADGSRSGRVADCGASFSLLR